MNDSRKQALCDKINDAFDFKFRAIRQCGLSCSGAHAVNDISNRYVGTDEFIAF